MTDLSVQNPPPADAPGVAAARALDAVKVYGQGDTEVVALDHVTVEFRQGQFTAIMGPSGSGKSTLMHCLAGLDTLSSGAAYIGDTNLAQLSDNELTLLRRERVGFVFQAFNLIPTISAEENIALPADDDDNRRILAVLAYLRSPGAPAAARR